MKIYKNAYEIIRILSGVFNKNEDEMASRLYYCCLLARWGVGDVDLETVNSMLEKIGIKLEAE